MMGRFAILTAASVLVVALAGCGKQGDLERPAPLWGAQAKADYAAQQRQAAEAKSHGSADNQIEPLPDVGDGADNAAGPPP